MYHFMFLFFLVFPGLEVHGQFSTLEVTGSGDGVNENSTYSRLPLLDDNGDISTVVTGTDVTKDVEDNLTDTSMFSTDSGLTEKLLINDTFTDITVTLSSQSSIPTSDLPTTEMPITDTEAASTTKSVSTTSSITETTTVPYTTTEEIPSSTETTSTSTTTAKTTKKPIKTDSATEVVDEYRTTPKDTAAKIPPTVAPASTIPMSEGSGKRCSFVDNGLKCDVEPICYGDGEIDCTEDEEMDSYETEYSEEMPSSSHDPDYVIEGRTSESYPVRRIDDQKIDLFKMYRLTTRDDAATSEMTEKMDPPSLALTTPLNEELYDYGNTEENDTAHFDNVQDSEVSEELTIFPPPTESTVSFTAFNDETLSPFIGSTNVDVENKDAENADIGYDDLPILGSSTASEIQINETVTHEDLPVNSETSTENLALSVYMTTPPTLEKVVSEESVDKDEDQPELTRIKRDKTGDDSIGFYTPSLMSQAERKASPLESSKKKLKVNSCKLTGNLVCVPRPIKSSCSGKSMCQVPPQAIETVENPATQKGLEKWTIAVIVVCAITATFTITLLIYLVFTSYKKLKVQPQNGVTTLNYVNSTQP